MHKFGLIASIFMISNNCIKGYLSCGKKISSIRNSHHTINKSRIIVFKAFSSSLSEAKTDVIISNSDESTVSLDWTNIKSENSKSYRIIFNRIPDGPLNLEVVCSPKVSLRNLVPGSSYAFSVSEICGTVTTALKSGVFSTTKSISVPNVSPTASLTELSRLEIRVGKILEISKHPEADNLYIESVDVGESTPRTIVSGLVEYCSIESLLHQQVIVLCNLKPRALKGVTSYGMLLCSSNADHTKVEPLKPPAGVANGQLITFEGHIPEPVEAGNRATKAFTKVADDLFVDDNGIATYQGIPFMTPLGSCTSSLKGKIS